MHSFAEENEEIDIDERRKRTRKMNDGELRAFGEAARYMCSKPANGNNPARRVFLIQLAEGRWKWKRRRLVTGQQ